MHSSLSGPFHSNCWVDSEHHQYSATALYCIMLMVLKNDCRQIITSWSKEEQGRDRSIGQTVWCESRWGGREMETLWIVNIPICRVVADGFKKLFHPVCYYQKTWFSVHVNIRLSWACEQAHWRSGYYSLLQQEAGWFYGFLDHGLWYFQKLKKSMWPQVSATKPKLPWFNKDYMAFHDMNN